VGEAGNRGDGHGGWLQWWVGRRAGDGDGGRPGGAVGGGAVVVGGGRRWHSGGGGGGTGEGKHSVHSCVAKCGHAYLAWAGARCLDRVSYLTPEIGYCK
jgi:hypothetical protein